VAAIDACGALIGLLVMRAGSKAVASLGVAERQLLAAGAYESTGPLMRHVDSASTEARTTGRRTNRAKT